MSLPLQTLVCMFLVTGSQEAPMKQKKMFYIADDSMLQHFAPWDSYHIEVPERLKWIYERLKSTGLEAKAERLKARKASEEEIQVVHTKRYVDHVKTTKTMNLIELEEFSAGYEDIYVNENTYDLALLAAGSAIDLVKNVIETKNPGFAAVRPPGHHAFPDAGCGFCIFNNVAIAAKKALSFGAKRVLIVDWDVHAGQGTQECIEDEENIRLVSIHRFQHGHFWPNLPQSAVETKFNGTVNVPLNSIGMGDSDFLAIVQLVVLPMIQDFKPELIIVSCGFDAALGDPEGEMRITPAGYGTMTRMLMNTGVPLAVILEGGYFLESIAADAEYVVRALQNEPVPMAEKKPIHAELGPVIRRIHDHYSDYYPTFKQLESVLAGLTGKKTIEEEAEYTGERNVTFPHATRGLYSERPEEVVQRFRDELEGFIKGYEKNRTYPTISIKYSTDDKVGVIASCTQNGVHLKVHSGLAQIVHYLVALPINPLLPPPIDSISTAPSAELLANLVNALKEFKSSDDFAELPVFQL